MEKEYPIKLKESEIEEDIEDLNQDEELNLFIKVQRGARKYKKLLDLVDILGKGKDKK